LCKAFIAYIEYKLMLKACQGPVSYPVIGITHPSIKFFVPCVFVFECLREQGFESSVNKEFLTVNDALIH
jgi:hypothetical protein